MNKKLSHDISGGGNSVQSTVGSHKSSVWGDYKLYEWSMESVGGGGGVIAWNVGNGQR